MTRQRSFIPRDETLLSRATTARLLRVPVAQINALIESGAVKTVRHLGQELVCLEACEAALGEGGADA